MTNSRTHMLVSRSTHRDISWGIISLLLAQNRIFLNVAKNDHGSRRNVFSPFLHKYDICVKSRNIGRNKHSPQSFQAPSLHSLRAATN